MDGYAYMRKYSRTGTSWKPSTSPATIGQAHASIEAIRNRMQITIPMLQSILSLTAHPESLSLLNDTFLIQDLVLLMYHLQKVDSRLPFGDEFGYLCFRILVLATGVSILSRSEIGDIILDDLCKPDRPDHSGILMGFVVSVVDQQMFGSSESPDRLLGWSTRDPGKPIMTKANALLLLDIMWKDRKGFLRAWTETRAPVLTGLLFILWRCVHVAGTPDRWVMFCEVQWRYYIVAGTDQFLPLNQFHDDARKYYELWSAQPTTVDLEDARTKLEAFILQMSSASGPYPLPILPTMGNMILFVLTTSMLQPGIEDLFVPFLRVIFHCYWESMAIQEQPRFNLTPGNVSIVLMPVRFILAHLVKYSPNDAKEFIRETAEVGIIEALVQGFALLNEDVNDKVKVLPLVEPCHGLMSALRGVVPSADREVIFADAFVEWFKALRYMDSRASTFSTNTKRTNWYILAQRCLVELGSILGYKPLVKHAETMTRGCAYTRCPDPNSVKGVRFECACNQGIMYCGRRCQQTDWMMDYLPTSHRHSCIWSDNSGSE